MKKRLEFKDSSSDKFWEIELLGASHIVRFGRAGTDGQEMVKEFANEAAALKEAEKLVAAKLLKGYVEVEIQGETQMRDLFREAKPEPLDYAPMPEEKVKLFTPEKLRNLNAFCSSYWRRKMEGLLRETMYDKRHERMGPKAGSGSLAEQFEEIAWWVLPDMQKTVARDAQGLVSEIRYAINGVQVLTLARLVENGYTHGRIVPFLVHERMWGYRFGKQQRMLEGTRQLLSRYASFCAAHLEQIAGAEIKYQKDAKIRKVAEGNIALVVQNLMAETGYEYDLEEETKTVLLRVRVQKHRFVEISLPHRSFLERVGDVLPASERVDLLLKKCKVPFLLGNREGCPQWGKVERGYPYARYNTDWAHCEREKIKRWQKLLTQPLTACLDSASYEYSVNLYTRYHWWLNGYEAESDACPLSIHVAMPQRKVLHLLFSYEGCQALIPHILPTIELVKKTMKEAKLGFKLLSTRGYEYRALGCGKD